MKIPNRKQVIREFAEVVNRNNLEAGSNTPDCILAEYLVECLESFNRADRECDKWHGNIANSPGFPGCEYKYLDGLKGGGQ